MVMILLISYSLTSFSHTLSKSIEKISSLIISIRERRVKTKKVNTNEMDERKQKR